MHQSLSFRAHSNQRQYVVELFLELGRVKSHDQFTHLWCWLDVIQQTHHINHHNNKNYWNWAVFNAPPKLVIKSQLALPGNMNNGYGAKSLCLNRLFYFCLSVAMYTVKMPSFDIKCLNVNLDLSLKCAVSLLFDLIFRLRTRGRWIKNWWTKKNRFVFLWVSLWWWLDDII